VAIQGVAGAGKSTVLKPVADILREEGRAVLGLAVQNTLVQMLERDTGIPINDRRAFCASTATCWRVLGRNDWQKLGPI